MEAGNKQAANLEEETYTLRYLQQLYQSQYGAVSSEINRVVAYLGELNTAQKTIESADQIGGREALVHLGANVYMSAKSKKLDNVIVSVGGGYLVEKTITQAKQFLASKIEHITEMFNKLINNRNELVGAMQDVSLRLEEIGAR